MVWTDHMNLEYIRPAKRVNARQARWALFFYRFDFTLSYRPGSKSIKPDALFHLFDPGSSLSNILLYSSMVGASLEEGVRRTSLSLLSTMLMWDMFELWRPCSMGFLIRCQNVTLHKVVNQHTSSSAGKGHLLYSP